MVDVFHLFHVLSVLYVLRPLSMFSDLYSCSPIQYCEIPQFVEPCPRLVSKSFHKNREKTKVSKRKTVKVKSKCQSTKQMPVNAPAWVLETAQLRGDFLVWSGTSPTAGSRFLSSVSLSDYYLCDICLSYVYLEAAQSPIHGIMTLTPLYITS